MLQDFVQWGLKTFLQMVMWVFILSFEWNGMTLFDRCHEVFVQNSIVEAAGESLSDLWAKVKTTAVVSFHKVSESYDMRKAAEQAEAAPE